MLYFFEEVMVPQNHIWSQLGNYSMDGREGSSEYGISDGFHVCLTVMVPLLKVNTKPAWCLFAFTNTA